VPSFDAGEAPRRSTSSLGATPVLLTTAFLDLAPLSQVVFVHDYLQMVFGDSRLSIYATATVSSTSRSLVRSDVGFCDALVALIGKTVTSADYARMRQLRLTFENGESVTVSLLGDAAIGPELFQLDRPGLPTIVEQVA
jgi:hypothetical protein